MSSEPEAVDAPVIAAPTRRRGLPLALIVVASLLAFLGTFALWANRQLLDTGNWTDTSSELLEDDEIREQVSIFLVDRLYANVDVEARLAEALPPRLQPLAGPAAGGLRDLAVRGTDGLLTRPRPQRLWEEANRRAHRRLLQVVEGGGDNVATEGGAVTLNLQALLGQTADRVGVGERAAGRIPDSAAEIRILESDNLELAQDAVRVLKGAAIALVAVAIGLIALAIGIAAGWRREALRAAGFGLAIAGGAALVARSFAGDAVVDALASTEAVRPAAEHAWSISTSLLVEAASAAILYGVVMVAAAWLAGPTAWATAVRRALAPYLREARLAYGALAVIALVLLAWGPTPALRRPLTAIVLIGLLALGTELLRRQTAREFPGASREASLRRLRERLGTVWPRPARAATPPGDGAVAAEAARLERVERLGRLRDAGVLDAAEFAREKAAILGERPPGGAEEG